MECSTLAIQLPFYVVNCNSLFCFLFTEKGRELILLIQLNKPAHTLLSAVAFSPSNTITIGFGANNDPTHPTELVFTSEKKQCTTNVATNAHRNTNKKFPTKSASEQSYLDHPKELQEISPIELPPNTPAVVSVHSHDIHYLCILVDAGNV